MAFSLDHVVIFVSGLDRTIADYEALGFTVLRGGDHPDGVTHNALVVFANGSYLELIEFRQPAEQRRWWRIGSKAGEGFVDFALLPHRLADDLPALRSRGLNYEGPLDGGRKRPDGEQLLWQTARQPSSDLPFFCGDITPRHLRVPEGAARQHPNSATGIAGITIAVRDLEASIGRYKALLALQDDVKIQDGIGLRVAQIPLGGTRITLASPAKDAAGAESHALQAHLSQRGETPYALAIAGVKPGHSFDPARTHGARIERA